MELQDSMERDGAAEAGSAARAAVGAALREAREGMGMSVEEVAGRLKFAARQVAALEAGDFSQLPEMAFVRGFVRSYARLLQLDEKALLDALPGAPATSAVQARAGGNEVPRQGAERMQQNLFWVGAAVVVVVLGIIAWKYDTGETKPAATGNAVETAQISTAPVAPASQPAEMQPPAQSAQPAQPAETSGTGGAAQSGETGAGVAPAPQAPHAAAMPQAPAYAPPAVSGAPGGAAHNGEKKPAHPATHSAAAKASGVPAVTTMARVKPGVEQQAASGATAAAPSRMVHLEFTEDSWVEVRDGTGKILLSMLGKQGTSRNASGPPPLSVVVGNAKGVKLVYKGQPVTLQPMAGSEVARLKLE